MMQSIEHNRPDIPTGHRIMKGHKVNTYPTLPVIQAEMTTDEGGNERVRVTPAYGGGRATMSIEAFHETCYPAEYIQH